MARVIPINAVPAVTGSRYPTPYDQPCAARQVQRLAQAVGLTQFGVSLTRIPPGVYASQRHWHSHEDELFLLLEGELVLIDDAGECVVRPGVAIGCPAGEADAHTFRNDGATDAVLLAIGTRDEARESCTYPDIDMVTTPERYRTDRDPYRRLSTGDPL